MKLLLITVSLILCVFTSIQCSSKKQPKITETQRRQLELLNEIQERQKLTDEQVEASLNQMVVGMNTLNEMVAADLMTQEDLWNLPKKMKSLLGLVHEMELDGGIIALNSLKLYQSEKRGNLETYLRLMIESSYSTVFHRDEKAYKDFKKDVDEHAQKDPLLKKLLKDGFKALK